MGKNLCVIRSMRAGKIVTCLGLVLLLEIGIANAQNVGDVENLLPQNLEQKDSLPQESLPQDAVEGKLPFLQQTGTDVPTSSSSDNQPLSEDLHCEANADAHPCFVLHLG